MGDVTWRWRWLEDCQRICITCAKEKMKAYLITLTDHPKFCGSELSVLSKDDRISCVRVFESTFPQGVFEHHGNMQAQNSYQQILTAQDLPATKRGSRRRHTPTDQAQGLCQLRLHLGYRVLGPLVSENDTCMTQ